MMDLPTYIERLNEQISRGESSGFTPSPNCADCGATTIETTNESEPFKFRVSEDELVDIPCVVPVRNCKTCGMKYMDYEAEIIHTKAIRDYLLKRMEAGGR